MIWNSQVAKSGVAEILKLYALDRQFCLDPAHGSGM